MSDFFLQLGAHPQARRFIKSLGLPVPLPPTLARTDGPWEARPLADRTVIVGRATGESTWALEAVLADMLVTAGANPMLVGEVGPAFRALGEAYGRPVRALALASVPDTLRAHALVFDASAVVDLGELRALYDFFHPLLPALAPSGRVVVLGRLPGEAPTPVMAAARAALEGFVRSLAKEIGKRGATAQLVRVGTGAESRLPGLLRFLLSARSAFVTGQVLTVTAAVATAGEPCWVQPLEGKVALVTGAARGIGAATARKLAAEGARVICLDRPVDEAALGELARAIGGEALAVDVGDIEAPLTIARELRTRHGGVDLVVHNAGITRDKTLARMSPEAWDATLDINLAAITRIDAALDGGVLRDGGREVCLASVAGIAGNVGQTNYAASKAGLAAYAHRRAGLLAARGIAVNAVAPGFIETRLTAAIPLFVREAGRRLAALGQGGLPEDVAEVIAFLCTPGAAGLSGALVRVCGGAFIGA